MKWELITLVALFVALVVHVEQQPAAACLASVHFGLPIINNRPAHAVSAEGGSLRQACLPAPVNGA